MSVYADECVSGQEPACLQGTEEWAAWALLVEQLLLELLPSLVPPAVAIWCGRHCGECKIASLGRSFQNAHTSARIHKLRLTGEGAVASWALGTMITVLLESDSEGSPPGAERDSQVGLAPEALQWKQACLRLRCTRGSSESTLPSPSKRDSVRNVKTVNAVAELRSSLREILYFWGSGEVCGKQAPQDLVLLCGGHTETLSLKRGGEAGPCVCGCAQRLCEQRNQSDTITLKQLWNPTKNSW